MVLGDQICFRGTNAFLLCYLIFVEGIASAGSAFFGAPGVRNDLPPAAGIKSLARVLAPLDCRAAAVRFGSGVKSYDSKN